MPSSAINEYDPLRTYLCSFLISLDAVPLTALLDSRYSVPSPGAALWRLIQWMPMTVCGNSVCRFYRRVFIVVYLTENSTSKLFWLSYYVLGDVPWGRSGQSHKNFEKRSETNWTCEVMAILPAYLQLVSLFPRWPRRIVTYACLETEKLSSDFSWATVNHR